MYLIATRPCKKKQFKNGVVCDIPTFIGLYGNHTVSVMRCTISIYHLEQMIYSCEVRRGIKMSRVLNPHQLEVWTEGNVLQITADSGVRENYFNFLRFVLSRNIAWDRGLTILIYRFIY